jgi:LacI family transcriptional regulator
MPRTRKTALRRAATLADVGRAAGVSVMAASAVINGGRTSSRIAAATSERILAAAARLGYRRNAAAHALVNRRMHTIGVASVLAGGELNHYFLEVFNGILAAAAQHEQNTTVFSLHDWTEAPRRLGRFCDGRIDGMILVGPPFRAGKVTLPAHTPFVSIHANHPLPGVMNIESDEERGACQMVKHGLELGHRRIMHLTGPRSDVGVRRRIRGYKHALAAAGVRFDPDLLVSAQYNSEEGRQALRAWLDSHHGRALPQMIFCGSDAIALGCLEALSERGLRVPDDVSVAGFDDTLAARITMPQLASVRQPLSAMGGKAVDLLLAQIEPRAAPPPPVKSLVFPTELVLRASLAPPPDRRDPLGG